MQKCGLPLLVTANPELVKYLHTVVGQLTDWLCTGSVQKLVVAISNVENGQVLKRWQLDIECDKAAGDDGVSLRPREVSESHPGRDPRGDPTESRPP